MSVSESPQKNPVGALVQDRCMRISSVRLLVQDLCMRISCAYLCVRTSASKFCMTTCARSLYADLLRKISLSGCLHQDPVGPLVQDLCMRISCARCLRFTQQNPAEALVQDRCMRISCARCLCQDLLSRTTCARCLYAGLLSKISLSGSLHQDPVVGPLVQDHCMTISCARCLCVCAGMSVSGASRGHLCKITV